METAGDISHETVVNLPKYKSLDRTIPRKRATDSALHSNKEIATDSGVEHDPEGDNFLISDSGYNDKNRMLIFATDQT